MTMVEQVQALAEQLSVRDQLRLIAALVQRLEGQTPDNPALPPTQDAWTRWNALRRDLAAQNPDARPSERLIADRDEREAMLRGSTDNVHP